MKAGKVLDILQISRGTLIRYRRKGYLKYKELPTGHFDYDDDSVYLLKNKQSERYTFVYGRVSTYKQKQDLENQIEELLLFAKSKGYSVNNQYKDIASGISFKNRNQFFDMLDEIIQGKVKRVIITHKDRLSRVGYELFEYLFKKYGTEIIVVSDLLDPKTDEQELFEEIISLLHSFSMKSYSHRRKERKIIEETLNKNMDNKK